MRVAETRGMTRPWVFRGWRLAILLGIGVTALLLMLAQDQETLRIESPVAASDRAFPEYVASLVGAPVQPGDEYQVLRNGDEVFPPMLDAIRQAKNRVSFESFRYKSALLRRR